MRRFLVALSLAGLLVGVMSAGGAAKGPPTGAGLTANPTNVNFTMIPVGATEADYRTVVITNGTTNVLHYRSPGLLAAPFSVGMNTCGTLNPQRPCTIWYRAGGSTAGTFKATVVQPFYWLDAVGAEHTVNVKLRFTATVSTDQRPTADSQSVSAVAGVAQTLTLTGGDPDGDTLTFSIPNPPDNGTVGAISTPICAGIPSTCTAEVTYTPNAGYSGTDYVIFKTNDGLFDSKTAGTVTVTVTGPPSNQAPAADDNWVDVNREVATTITLSGSDADGDDLSFTIATSPGYGTLGDIATPICSGGYCTADVTYTSDVGYTGSDSFTFVTNDGTVDSPTAGTISITVPAPLNQAPWAEDLPSEGYWVGGTVTLRGGDPDGDNVEFSIVDQPSHGSLGAIGYSTCDGVISGFGIAIGPMVTGSVCTLEVSYTPEEGYTGQDSFTYRASDGSLESDIATVTFTGPS